MQRSVWLVLAATVSAVAGGCAGDGSTASLSDAVACLKDEDVTLLHTTQFAPGTPPRARWTPDFPPNLQRENGDDGVGAFEADLGSNTVTVGFEKSDDAADLAEATMYAERTGFIPRTDLVLFRDGNVVIFWEKIPSDADNQQLEDCL